MIKFYTVSFYANSFPALYEWTLLYFIFCGSMGWDGMSFIVFYVMWCVMSYASSFIVMAWMLVIWFWFFTGIVCIVRMDGRMDTCGGCENIRIYKFHVLCDVMCDVLCVVFYCNGMNVSDLILILHRHCVYCANGWMDGYMRRMWKYPYL